MVAVAHGLVEDFVYLYEVAPDFDGGLGTALEKPKFVPTVRCLSGLGDVTIGMLCDGKFTEL